MPYYRKKPKIVQARRLGTNNENINEMADWIGEDAEIVRTERPQSTTYALHIHTLEGTMIATPGDFVIKGVAGEFYPRKEEIFRQTYEEVPRGQL